MKGATVETHQFLTFPSEILVNAGTYVRAGEKTKFNLSVTNLFNNYGRIPLIIEPLGRRFAVSMNHRF